MPASGPEMAAEKPVVQILVAGDVERQMLDCIGWGLEEEGIPAARERVAGDTAANILAARAARASRLHVGIGVSGRFAEAALSHRDMSTEEPLLTAPVGRDTRDELVLLGKNAARLVKGNPFCFEHPGTLPDPDVRPGYSPEIIEQVVARVVEALFNHIEKRRDR